MIINNLLEAFCSSSSPIPSSALSESSPRLHFQPKLPSDFDPVPQLEKGRAPVLGFPPSGLPQFSDSRIMKRQKRWLGFAVFLLLISAIGGREIRVRPEDDGAGFNHTLATILVEYASAVYMSDLTELFTWTCPRCEGQTKGFEVVELIVDVQNCLQAFVGVSEGLNSIIIAFRGTQEHSIQNWIEDLFWKQLDIQYPGMPGAMVHRGFYYAYHNTTIRPAILSAVERTKYMYGVENIMVTGHSMGGAMASFCGLDLAVKCGEHNIQVLTFGQPRIGNAAFASYYIQLVPNTIRVTNGHDLVPHLPPYISRLPQRTYHHFPKEVWLYNAGLGSSVYPTEKICDDTGEDPSCSRSVSGNSLADHLTYYGVELCAETWGSCSIVWDPRWEDYGGKDLRGNILLSKNPATPALKLPSDSGAKLDII